MKHRNHWKMSIKGCGKHKPTNGPNLLPNTHPGTTIGDPHKAIVPLTNKSAESDDSLEDYLSRCSFLRGKVFRNWKFLKEKFFESISPTKLLEELHDMISADHVANLHSMPKQLAFDYVLIKGTQYISNKATFEKFSNTINNLNKSLIIDWDKDTEIPQPKTDDVMLKMYVERKHTLEENLNAKHILEIKDDFVEQLIFTLDHHEKIISHILKKTKSVCFIEIVFEVESIKRGSIPCLDESLRRIKGVNWKIHRMLKEFEGKKGPFKAATTISCTEVDKNIKKTNEPIDNYLMEMDLKVDDVKRVNAALERSVPCATSTFVCIHGSYVEKTCHGCLEIYLRSVDGDIRKRIETSLKDGSLLALVTKIVNAEEVKNILKPGKYELSIRIKPLKETTNSCNDKDNEIIKTMASQVIPANRSFLIKELDTESLLKAWKGQNLRNEAKFIGNCEEQADILIGLIQNLKLEEFFFEVLREQKMTYVLNRLDKFKDVYARAVTDLPNIRRRIISTKTFADLITTVDLNTIKKVFIERNIFEPALFHEIEQTFEDQPDQGIARFLVKVLEAGSLAVLTFIEALYACELDELADDILNNTQDISEEKQNDDDLHADIIRAGEHLFEGTYELLVKESSNCDLEYELNETSNYATTADSSLRESKTSDSTMTNSQGAVLPYEPRKLLKSTKREQPKRKMSAPSLTLEPMSPEKRLQGVPVFPRKMREQPKRKMSAPSLTLEPMSPAKRLHGVPVFPRKMRVTELTQISSGFLSAEDTVSSDGTVSSENVVSEEAKWLVPRVSLYKPTETKPQKSDSFASPDVKKNVQQEHIGVE